MGGTYEAEMDGKKFTGSLDLAPIEIGLRQLQMFRDDGRVPSEDLLWEIRLYEWILAQPDAVEKTRQYGAGRLNPKGAPTPKREVVAKLGWDVP